MGLGAVHTFSLAEARERARQQRQLLADGIDPLGRKREVAAAKRLEAAKTVTFEQAAEQYLQSQDDGNRHPRFQQLFRNSLRDYVLPKIGKLPVASIDTGLVVACLEPIWKTINPTARRVRGRIENVLDWATVRQYRSGDNPARWGGHLEHVLAEQNGADKHHAALSYEDVPAFMQQLRAARGVNARALEFCILTAARTGEAIGAVWSELDLDKAVWTIPAERMKMPREHRVPLPPSVVALLQGLPREKNNPFVFIGAHKGTGIGDKVLLRCLSKLRDDLTVHGFRSTFRDWIAEQTSFPREVAEQALAHSIGSAVEAAYRRGDLFDKRRRLMEAWAMYCSSQPATKTADVVPLRGA
jgi:integrase